MNLRRGRDIEKLSFCRVCEISHIDTHHSVYYIIYRILDLYTYDASMHMTQITIFSMCAEDWFGRCCHFPFCSLFILAWIGDLQARKNGINLGRSPRSVDPDYVSKQKQLQALVKTRVLPTSSCVFPLSVAMVAMVFSPAWIFHSASSRQLVNPGKKWLLLTAVDEAWTRALWRVCLKSTAERNPNSLLNNIHFDINSPCSLTMCYLVNL